MLGRDVLGDLAKKIDEQDDPKEVYKEAIEVKKKRLEEGGVPDDKRPI